MDLSGNNQFNYPCCDHAGLQNTHPSKNVSGWHLHYGSLGKVHRACMAAVLNGALCWHLSLGRAWATACLLRHGYDTKLFISWHHSRQPNYNRHLKERENKASREEYIPHERRAQGTAWCGSNHIFSLIMILTCFVMALRYWCLLHWL